MLHLPAQAQRVQGALKGIPPETRPLPIKLKGKLVQLEGSLSQTSFIDVQGVRFKLKLRNVIRDRVRFAIHVAIFDSKGELLGSSGVQEVVGLEAGKETTASLDIALPRSGLKRAARYEVVVYEARAEIGRK